MRIGIVVLLFTIGLSSSRGMDLSTADSLVHSAQEAYAAGDHQLALDLYDSVYVEYTSAGLLHNIANCYFKLEDVPRAILFYERALKYSPGDEDIQANLELARQQIVDRVNEMPRFSFENTLTRILGGSDIDLWAWRSIWIWVLCITLLIVGLLSRDLPRKVLIGAAALVFVAMLVSTSFAYLRYADIKQNSEAIILAPVLDVHSEPATSSTKLFVLHKGTKVTVLQALDEWCEVRLMNGSVGWIPTSSFERI